jgi:hypothetical protein
LTKSNLYAAERIVLQASVLEYNRQHSILSSIKPLRLIPPQSIQKPFVPLRFPKPSALALNKLKNKGRQKKFFV